MRSTMFSFFFFFNDTATTEIYTLSLHDALPISSLPIAFLAAALVSIVLERALYRRLYRATDLRSEEHTSELQSPCNLVCRLLLEKKKKNMIMPIALTSVPFHTLPPFDSATLITV